MRHALVGWSLVVLTGCATTAPPILRSVRACPGAVDAYLAAGCVVVYREAPMDNCWNCQATWHVACAPGAPRVQTLTTLTGNRWMNSPCDRRSYVVRGHRYPDEGNQAWEAPP